jgi:hypothetical protein
MGLKADWAFLRILGNGTVVKSLTDSEVLPMSQSASSRYTSSSDALSISAFGMSGL